MVALAPGSRKVFTERGWVPVWQDRLDDLATGMWSCSVSGGGLSARGFGRGKKEARREAAKGFLSTLRDLVGSG